MRTSHPIVALLALSTATFAGNVLVVDANGPGFKDISGAVAVASDGDVVLVKSGEYSSFTISTQGVSVVADTSHTVHVNGTAQVVYLGATRDVLLSGLHIFGDSIYGLYVGDNHGSVRVQNCHVQGKVHTPGVWIGASRDVALTASTVLGGAGIPNSPSQNPNANGGSGLVVSSARLALYGSSVTGGAGAPTNCHGGSGADGLRALHAYVFAGDSLVRGGTGASGQNVCYSSCYLCVCRGGNAGSGIVLLPPAGLPPTRLDTCMDLIQAGLPGSGGANVMGCCGLSAECDGDSGLTGNAIIVASGNVHNPMGGVLPAFSASVNPVREQSITTLRFMGQPGDHVYLYMNTSTGFRPSEFKGVQLVPREGQPYVAVLGPVDASGMLQVPFPIGELGLGVESRILHLQPLHENSGGHFAWGNPVHLVMLDQAF